MNYSALRDELAKVLDEKRYRHSLGVSVTAEQLAKRFGVSPEKAKIAGLLHDCARELPINKMAETAEKMHIVFSEVERFAPILLHAAIGAMLVKSRYKVDDPQISRAIRLHTTGGAHMDKLDKIVYLADMIEPGREYPEAGALRKLAERNLDEAILTAFNQSISFVITKGNVIHPDTINARNEILLKGLY